MTLFDRLGSWAPYVLGITRILTGTMFALHGSQKVLGWFGGMPPGAPAWVVWGAGLIELIGGILIALGLFTRPAAFLASGTMAVAYFYGHARGGSFLPTVNGGELAVVYCWIFLYFAAAGPGAFALDNLLFRGRVAPALNGSAS
ncbi:MAG TPA: DoxX family protein [Thermoanaerobaculia bacterium]